jgi:atypical dual specificity phosphatase
MEDMSIRNFSWVIPGRLAGCAIPGGGVPGIAVLLDEDLAALSSRGIRRLVSLTDMPRDFESTCLSNGLEWVSYPIPNKGLPESLKAARRLVGDIVSAIRSDIPVCVHCYAGVGRAGLVLSSVVGVYYNLSAEEAIARVREVRKAFDSVEQEQFVKEILDAGPQRPGR